MWFKARLSNGFNWISGGDLTGYSFTIGDFTKDGTWRDLSLASIIGAKHCLCHIEIALEAATTEFFFGLRKNGNSNAYNKAGQYTQVANKPIFADLWVETDTSGVVEYTATSGTWSRIDLTVKDWIEL